MKEKIYNFPLVQHAIEKFGEASEQVKGLVGFLENPNVNLEQVESIRLPNNDFIAQHGRDAHSSIPATFGDGSEMGFGHTLYKRPNLSADAIGNVVFRPRPGFNTWDHGGFILSTLGLDHEGFPTRLFLPRVNRPQAGGNAVGSPITLEDYQDQPLGTAMNLAIANASAGRISLEEAANMIDARVPLHPNITGKLGLGRMNDPMVFRNYGNDTYINGLMRRMKQGIIVGETGRVSGVIPGEMKYYESVMEEHPIDMFHHRPVAILHGRQLAPHPSYMLQDSYFYDVDRSDYAKEDSWLWAQYMRIHNDGPYFLDNMGPYFQDEGLDPHKLRLSTNIIAAYPHQSVARQMNAAQHRPSDMEKEVNAFYYDDDSGYFNEPGIDGWKLWTDGRREGGRFDD